MGRRRGRRAAALLFAALGVGPHACAAVHAWALTHPAAVAMEDAAPRGAREWARTVIAGRRPPRLTPDTRPSELGLPYVERILRPPGGPILAAWWVPPPGARSPVVVLAHGYGERRDRPLLSRARALHRAGYGVLLFDFRGFGASGGATTSLGFTEREDVSAALAAARALGDGRAAVFGRSMGAAAAVAALADGARAEALVVEAIYASPRQAAAARLAGAGFPPVPLAALVDLHRALQTGTPLNRPVPAEDIARTRVPVLVIAGEEDRLAPPGAGRRLLAAAPGGGEILVVPGAGHGEVYARGGARYDATLVDFLDRVLAGDTVRRRGRR
ncbi:alpha/beta hydrolase [Myxococcota bacterium]|nr:alpha/beta hydrolase [Myxococcota bacterium]